MSIEEKNRAIFDFMGCTHSKDANMDAWEMSLLKYHTSWDALIPVWHKIWHLCYLYPITPQEREWNEIKGNRCARVILYGTIEEAHTEIVSAIQWYESTVPQPEGKGKEGV